MLGGRVEVCRTRCAHGCGVADKEKLVRLLSAECFLVHKQTLENNSPLSTVVRS
jgi:hypothetical protein